MGFDFSLKAATRRQRVRRTLARVCAAWRTGLPGPVLVLSAGTAVNSFGAGGLYEAQFLNNSSQVQMSPEDSLTPVSFSEWNGSTGAV